MRLFRRRVSDARNEAIAEQGCDGEDMAGETARMSELPSDVPPSPGHQQPIENMERFVDRGRDCLCCDGRRTVSVLFPELRQLNGRPVVRTAFSVF